MRLGGLPGVRRFPGLLRVPALAVLLAVVTVLLGVTPGTALASVALHHQLRPGSHFAPGAGMSLAQAPAGLRAAVRRTLGRRSAAAGRAYQKATLAAAGGAAGDRFGDSVAVSGSTVVVGAPGNNSLAGTAYVFALSGATWSQQAELTASGGASGDNFGILVAVSGSTAVVGAIRANSIAGAAYVFGGV